VQYENDNQWSAYLPTTAVDVAKLLLLNKPGNTQCSHAEYGGASPNHNSNPTVTLT